MRRDLKYYILGCVTLLGINLLFSQKVRFSHLSDKDGLPQNVINAIYQDKKGLLWIGCQDQLARYDGQHFYLYCHRNHMPNTISSNYITSISEYDSGMLIGTQRGVNLYNSADDGFQRVLENRYIRSLLSDHDHFYAIGHHRIYEVDSSFQVVDSILVSENVRILSACKGDKGLVVLTRKHDLLLYNDGILSKRMKVPFEISRQGFIRCEGSKVLISTRQKVVSCDLLTERFEELYDFGIKKAHLGEFVQSGDTLWVGSSKGIFKVNTITSEWEHIQSEDCKSHALKSDAIRSLLLDRQKNLWVGTRGGGLNIFYPDRLNFKHYYFSENDSFSLPSPIVFAIHETGDGRLLVGAEQKGITVYDKFRKKKDHSRVKLLENKTVLALQEVNRKDIWAGTIGHGLVVLNKQMDAVKYHFPGRNGSLAGDISNGTVTALLQDQDRMWVGTYMGLNCVDIETGKLLPLKMKEEFRKISIRSLVKTSEGDLLVGTRTGLFIIRGKSDELIPYELPAGLEFSNQNINTILVSYENHWWIGTNNGLNVFDPEKKTLNIYYQEDGLPNDYIYGILEDEQKYIWMSTNRGISRIDTQQEIGKRSFRNYKTQDGLQENEFNQNSYCHGKSGLFYFGGINGITEFDPDKIKSLDRSPAVYITHVSTYGNSVSLGGGIVKSGAIDLKARQNQLTISFIGVTLRKGSSPHFYYKMEGVDHDWIDGGDKSYASYQNLRGGNYTFRVRASLNNDHGQNNEAVLTVYIQPRLWEREGFYIWLVLSLGIIGFFIQKFRTRQIRRQNKHLEQVVRQRTSELAERNEDIMSSILYAKKLQQAVMPKQFHFTELFSQAFIYFKPKDVVSGDFYWFVEINGLKVVVAADCTGHGVPGAFMSMLGVNLLNQIVNHQQVTEPSKILEELHKGVASAVANKSNENQMNDGMDLSVVVFDPANYVLSYAGANRPLLRVSEGELSEFKPDKLPVGGLHIEGGRKFNTHTISYKPGDQFFLYTDGYQDQFGGRKGKKFMGKQFKQMLLETSHLDKSEQYRAICDRMVIWKGKEEQVDDMLVIGIQV